MRVWVESADTLALLILAQRVVLRGDRGTAEGGVPQRGDHAVLPATLVLRLLLLQTALRSWALQLLEHCHDRFLFHVLPGRRCANSEEERSGGFSTFIFPGLDRKNSVDKPPWLKTLTFLHLQRYSSLSH